MINARTSASYMRTLENQAEHDCNFHQKKGKCSNKDYYLKQSEDKEREADQWKTQFENALKQQ